MRLLITVLLSLVISACVRVPLGNYSDIKPEHQTSVSYWARQFGNVTKFPGGDNSEYEWCNSVATDGNGFIYCAGATEGSLGEPNGGAPYTRDAFIIKLDKDGNLIWATQLGANTKAPGGDNSGSERCESVAVDASGNVYCGGYTNGSLGAPNLGGEDAFIVKLNSSGELQWLKQFGTSEDDFCKSIKVDNSGNIYCGGETYGDLAEPNGGNEDIFLIKLDTNGNSLWMRQFGDITKFGDTSGSDLCYSIDLDSQGNVYCAGETDGDFAETADGWDALVLKVSKDGVPVWATHFGTTTKGPNGDTSDAQTLTGIDVTTSGEVVVTGYAQNSFADDFGGLRDILVMKLDANGSLIWATQIGNNNILAGGDVSGWEDPRAVVTDANGNIYVTGDTDGSLAEANGGKEDIFLLKLSPSGEVLWLKQFGAQTTLPGGTNNDKNYAFDMTIDRDGSLVIVGEAQDSFAGEFGGVGDAFVLKLNPDGEL